MIKISLLFKKYANLRVNNTDLLGLRTRIFQGLVFKWI